MKIEITKDYDEYECETCGTDYAEGGTVTIDGVEIVNLPAQAHCYEGRSFSESDLLVIALRRLGHTIEIDGNPWYIQSTIDDA